MRALTLTCICAVTLAACSGAPAQPIRDFGAVSISAVENNLETQKELTLPPSFSTLPQPTPGGRNLADN